MFIKDLKKIAFIKYGGLASGGTEVNFQTIAKHLSKNYQVDYYYCDPSRYIGSDFVHPPTDKNREEYLRDSNVNLIKFNVEYKDVTDRNHKWINTDFWDLFNRNRNKYSLILTTTAGPPEYPFIKIQDIPMVNIVTLGAGVSNQENIIKTVLISEFSKNKWVKDGGIEEKSVVIPVVREEIVKINEDFREKLGIENKFIFGMHQRNDKNIFSKVPLKAFRRIENKDNFFLLLGGSKFYDEYAKKIKLKNFIRLESSSDLKILNKFLNTLDVFTHGRKHGETFGLVLTEAMSYSLPLISHRADSNAQEEVIGDAGRVFSKFNTYSYSREMLKLQSSTNYYKKRSQKSYSRYNNFYNEYSVLEQYSNLIKECV